MAQQQNSHSEQARINGSKSKGPKTDAGKARSSANSLKHGFAAVINVVLDLEDKAAFNTHVAELHACYQPTDYAERTFVDQLASISWRQARLISLETALLDAQADYQHDHLTEISPSTSTDPYYQLVKTWQALARQPQKPSEAHATDPSLPPDGYDIQSLELLRRYQMSLDRQFRNTLLNFEKYRLVFAAKPPAPPVQPQPLETANQPAEPNEPRHHSPTRPQPSEIRLLTLVKPAPDVPPVVQIRAQNPKEENNHQ